MNKSMSDVIVNILPKVIPLQVDQSGAMQVNKEVILSNMNVFIGVVGDVKGSIILHSEPNVFTAVSQSMYGMALEGEMLDSFSGELGNMLAGSFVSVLSETGMSLDITPPNVIKGVGTIVSKSEMESVSVEFIGIGTLNVLLNLEKEKE